MRSGRFAAAQLARWGGATVIGTVTRQRDLDLVTPAVAHAVALMSPTRSTHPADAPEGVDRIVEVAFSDNADLDAAVAANDSVIAAYATRGERPEIPFWSMLFANITIRLLGSATISHPQPNTKPRPTSPPQHTREHSRSPAAIHCR